MMKITIQHSRTGQRCDMCGAKMKLVRIIRGERTYACKCGEWLKIRKGQITAAKWFDLTISYPSIVSSLRGIKGRGDGEPCKALRDFGPMTGHLRREPRPRKKGQGRG